MLPVVVASVPDTELELVNSKVADNVLVSAPEIELESVATVLLVFELTDEAGMMVSIVVDVVLVSAPWVLVMLTKEDVALVFASIVLAVPAVEDEVLVSTSVVEDVIIVSKPVVEDVV